MANNYNNKATQQRAVTARFPLSDYTLLLAEAEKHGTTMADMLRICWSRFREQQSLEERLQQLESRLFRRAFEINCAVAGLTSSERQEVLADVKQRLQEVRS
jgi:hypothetical protein